MPARFRKQPFSIASNLRALPLGRMRRLLFAACLGSTHHRWRTCRASRRWRGGCLQQGACPREKLEQSPVLAHAVPPSRHSLQHRLPLASVPVDVAWQFEPWQGGTQPSHARWSLTVCAARSLRQNSHHVSSRSSSPALVASRLLVVAAAGAALTVLSSATSTMAAGLRPVVAAGLKLLKALSSATSTATHKAGMAIVCPCSSAAAHDAPGISSNGLRVRVRVSKRELQGPRGQLMSTTRTRLFCTHHHTIGSLGCARLSVSACAS